MAPRPVLSLVANGRDPMAELRAAVDDLAPLDAVEMLLHVVEEMMGEAESPVDQLDVGHLPPQPRAIVNFMLAREGELVTRKQLMGLLYAVGADAPGENIIDVHLCRARRECRGVVEFRNVHGRGWTARRVGGEAV